MYLHQLHIVVIFLSLVVLSSQIEVKVIDPSKAIESTYIIQFLENANNDQRSLHLASLKASFSQDPFKNAILRQFDFGTFQGYSAYLSSSALEIVKKSSIVKTIEQDAIISKFQSCSSQSAATWGIDRIAEEKVFLDGNYHYNSNAGEGVDSYVVDTGININHQDFDGHAIWGANFADTNDTDCNGHGTHVAGTIGSSTFGIAKKTTLIAVKVLGCTGSGTYAGVISGIEFVGTSFLQRKRKSVANMSLGGPYSSIVNDAVSSSIKIGVVFVVAGGNDNANSCEYSPASTPDAITVGATGIDTDSDNGDQVDNRAYFSNYGTCLTVFAPGLQITSTWIGTKNNEILTISGTSMASPHVAGMSALYLSTLPQNQFVDPKDVKNWITKNASKNIVRFDCEGAKKKASCELSPNLFTYYPCN